MVHAAEAGIPPNVFYQLTVGEILIAIEGYQERERQTLISRVSAVLRGLGAVFGKKKQDPYQGLGIKASGQLTMGAVRRAGEAWLWRDEE